MYSIKKLQLPTGAWCDQVSRKLKIMNRVDVDLKVTHHLIVASAKGFGV